MSNEENHTHCKAVKKDGTPCTNQAKDNGYCGIQAHIGQGAQAVKSMVIEINNLAAEETVINPKEGNMGEIFHFMHTSGPGMPHKRVITNNPGPATRQAVLDSRFGNRVINVANSSASVLSINTGDWGFPLLTHRAVEMGVKFTAVSFDNDILKEMDEDELDGMIARANFAWASASNTVFIKFEGHEGFDLTPLGLNVENHKKLAKRLTEILRCTANYFYGDFSRREFLTPEGQEDIYHDGFNVIRRSFANKLGFTGTRGNIRLLTPEGTIKGDFKVVDDDKLDVDVLFHTENLKAELSTTGWTMATVMDHPPYHDLRHDDQTRGNFSFFVPEETVQEDLQLMVKNWTDSISEGGELYDYLDSQVQAFDDPIAVDLKLVQLADRLEDQAELIRSFGFPVASFSNIPFTRTGAMSRKMEANRIEKTDHFKRMFIPASNAFVGSVLTWETCTDMCGMEFPDEDGTRTFWDPSVGLVIPGPRFAETYDLHGGWDSDDTASMFAMYFYCSDDEKLDRLVDTGVIDSNLDVGRTPEEAVFAGLLIRRPNGVGEYSIESISEEMPWAFYDEERIPTFDLADAPESQATVFSKVRMGRIPTSVNYDHSFDRSIARDMIKAQLSNPGVGPFANVMMTIAATFGPDNVPDEMLAAMEDIIDSVQQTADALAFAAITQETTRLWTWFYNKVMDEKIKVDGGVLATRVPKKIGGGDDAIDLVDDIIEAGLVYAGPTYKIHKEYSKAIEVIKQAGMDLANEARQSTSTVRLVRNLSIANDVQTGRELKDWAVNWLDECGKSLRKLDYQFNKEIGLTSHIIERRVTQMNRRIAMEKLMDSWVETITDNDRFDTYDMVMALYKVIVTPSEKHLHGRPDRIFVQPSSVGHTSMLELFIAACESNGVLLDIQLDALTLS